MGPVTFEYPVIRAYHGFDLVELLGMGELKCPFQPVHPLAPADSAGLLEIGPAAAQRGLADDEEMVTMRAYPDVQGAFETTAR